MTQTILGSGGAIGIPLARELTKYTGKIRLVSRNPKKVNETDELYPVNLNNLNHIDRAVAGSEIVYVTIGFEYSTRVWRETWPSFLQAVIDACKKYHSRLVFFDNIYLYKRDALPSLTEDSPVSPPSEKGKVRALLHHMIFSEVEKHNLSALIARAADFYGPENANSILTKMVIDNLIKGKKAQVFGDIHKIHTFTYTPDAAKATAILGNSTEAYNQVWHVPTTKEKLTTLDWIELIAKELNKEVRIQHIPAWSMRCLGIFIPIMREFPEMLYQYDQDYIFDSTKFETAFGMKAIMPEEGIKRTINKILQIHHGEV